MKDFKYRVSFELDLPYEDIDDNIYHMIFVKAMTAHCFDAMEYHIKSNKEENPELLLRYQHMVSTYEKWYDIINNMQNYSVELIEKPEKV